MSFRAKTRDELVPAFKQLQRTQPDVMLRWFERGRVWESPEAARAAVLLARTEAKERKRPPTAERRGKDWRPGGEHKDPKARFELTRDQKRAKFKRNLIGSSAEAQIKAERPRTSESRPKVSIDPFGRKPRQT